MADKKFLDKAGLETLVGLLKDKVADSLEGLGGSVGIGGVLDVTTSSAATTLEKAASNLAAGSMVFYGISDSSVGLTSATSVTLHEDVAKLIKGSTYTGTLGASVGDLICILKYKVALIPVTVYKIFPLNDAKAAADSFPGADGYETIWDKTQVNKIPTIESSLSSVKSSLQGKASFYTKSESNMDNALTSGFYPWCTSGRPSGSDGAFTLKVVSSADADGNNYYTVEQTAYGRSGDYTKGKVYYRYIFVHTGGAKDFTDWVQIGGAASDDEVTAAAETAFNT